MSRWARNRCVALHASLLLLLLTAASPGLAADSTWVEGRWISGDGSGFIDIQLQNDSPVGRIAGSTNKAEAAEPGRQDALNPDPALRSRPLLNLTILQGFKSGGDGKWKDGRIYDPNSGKTYKCNITIVDRNTLNVRGYIGIALAGRTETWVRENGDNLH